MDWQTEYRSKLLSANEAAHTYIQDNDVVYFGGLMISQVILEAMYQRIRQENLSGVTTVGNLILSDLPFDDPIFAQGKTRYKAFFFGKYERAGSKAGGVTFVPLQLGNFYRYMKTKVKPNVVVVSVTPPDEQGNCNIGPFGSGFNPAGIELADRIIVQVNTNLPRVYGRDVQLPVRKITAIVEHDEPLIEYPMPDTTAIDQAIASYIIDLIPDGACIQLGLGGIANAVGYGLKCKKHLGVHTEMLTESMAHLHKLGVIDNSRKTFMPGVMVAGFTLGSQPHYDYINNNSQIYFAPYQFTNDVANIMKNDNMISINNALSVDLTGQVSSECMGFSQYSGTGGQVDFIRGASAADQGKSFIALASTVKTEEGVKSKIVLDFPSGCCTTALRSDVQYVVTEYGCVDLFGEDLPTRARKLISIAHPEFREELLFAAKKHHYVY